MSTLKAFYHKVALPVFDDIQQLDILPSASLGGCGAGGLCIPINQEQLLVQKEGQQPSTFPTRDHSKMCSCLPN